MGTPHLRIPIYEQVMLNDLPITAQVRHFGSFEAVLAVITALEAIWLRRGQTHPKLRR